MNDRELLELAAKAVGFSHEIFIDGKSIRRDLDGQPIYWNPLTDDGDALRLAVKLHMDINSYPCTEEIGAVQHRHSGVCKGSEMRHFERTLTQDSFAATRRAIVRAAAEIGKAMP